MKKQSRTVPRRRQSVSPTPRHLPLVDILIDTQAELQELVVASGLKVLEAMLEEDRAAGCGPRYAHQPARQAYRTGHTPSQVVLGGRKVAIRRPRARRAGEEVPLPTARAFANADPLNRRVVDQMLIGVATRQYARSLEPLGADVTTRGTSKSAVSRRFVAQTQAQLDAWRATPLDALDLVGLLIDGVHVGGHCIVVALGIDKMGAKHPLGLWEGATENATVCQGLLTNLGSRGLRTDRSLLVIVDGAKALDTAVTQTFGRAALVQRCQVHKGRNILEHLPEAQRPWVKAVLTRAYTNSHVKTAKRLLQDLARRLDTDYPSAATSVREGLDETLTVLGVGLSERLQRSLATTNAIESLLSRTRHVQRHVKRWRGGTMVLRWVAAGVPRSGEGVPPGARMSRYARAGRCPPGTRRAVRTRGVVRDGCVVVNQAAAEFQQRTGHPQRGGDDRDHHCHRVVHLGPGDHVRTAARPLVVLHHPLCRLPLLSCHAGRSAGALLPGRGTRRDGPRRPQHRHGRRGPNHRLRRRPAAERESAQHDRPQEIRQIQGENRQARWMGDLQLQPPPLLVAQCAPGGGHGTVQRRVRVNDQRGWTCCQVSRDRLSVSVGFLLCSLPVTPRL